jgi:hypothetical protein
MPVVPLMGVVVAKNTAIIDSTNPRIDISQAVLHHSIALEPGFLFQHRPPLSPERCSVSSILFSRLTVFLARFLLTMIRRADLTNHILAGTRGDVKYPIWQ